MKRRQFLKAIGGAAIVAVVPAFALGSSKPDNSFRDAIEALKSQAAQPIDGNYYAIVDPDTAKKLSGEFGHYEGIRFIEQTQITPSAPDNSRHANTPMRPAGLVNSRRHSPLSLEIGGHRRAPPLFRPNRTEATWI